MVRYNFYDFFAGGGMVSYGLGARWECTFANDIDAKKGAVYGANLGVGKLLIKDVGKVESAEIPGRADLAWASFPCQDLSLAGSGAGLAGERSGTFWKFWRLIETLAREGRAPRVIALENVYGALTSHGGRDFAAIGSALTGGGYCFGAVVIDAVRFVPQSRPRLFVVGVRLDMSVPAELIRRSPDPEWHPLALIRAQKLLGRLAADRWLWWSIPFAPKRNAKFSDFIEDEPTGVAWHSPEHTAYILSLMSARNLAKVETAKLLGQRVVGTVYRRTRPGECGGKTQRAEVRFDDVAGCLRTPRGGSSRQTILVVHEASVRSRLLSPREAARLMGLPDEYRLPERYNDAYHVAGDGVVVPVVRHLAESIIEPLLSANSLSVAA